MPPLYSAGPYKKRLQSQKCKLLLPLQTDSARIAIAETIGLKTAGGRKEKEKKNGIATMSRSLELPSFDNPRGPTTDGKAVPAPVTEAHLESPYFVGNVSALEIANPMYDVILGNISGVK
ncbi:hypothetical protein ElyMa_004444800 [Elysia marginata]|uniref:Uncharacterized protein n=1 Tax=Elysia marginata TaxID=1093978 RepID=A0AAV4HHK5_9GAST|nr:hypothetical protein ElyMa_004444800 [Elysia marginata]